MVLLIRHNFRQHLRQMYTEKNKDEMNETLDFQKIVWFNFGKGEKLVEGQLVEIDDPKVVWVRKTYNVKEEPLLCHSLRKKSL